MKIYKIFICIFLDFFILPAWSTQSTNIESLINNINHLNKPNLSAPDQQCIGCLHYHNPSATTTDTNCPETLIERTLFKDKKGTLNRKSPEELCTSNIPLQSSFASAEDLESTIRGFSHFSDLNTPTISTCLSKTIQVRRAGLQGLPEFNQHTLPKDKHRLVVAEYYSFLYRLNQGVHKNLADIAAIDQIIGQGNHLLNDVSCTSLESIPGDSKQQCNKFKQCNSDSASLSTYAHDTLIAMQGIEAIDRKIKALSGSRNRRVSKNKEEIDTLKVEKENIQNMYPWIGGKRFQSSYDAKDFNDFDFSKDNKPLEEQMAGLIEEQLAHTREQLLKHQDGLQKTVECLNADKKACDDIDVDKVIAKTPTIDNDNIFERGRRKIDKNNNDLSQSQRRENLRMSETDILFSTVNCLQKQREEVKKINDHLAMGGLDIAITIGTMGVGSTVVLGKMAGSLALRGSLRGGKALHSAQRLNKAKRLQGFGVMGTDASLSSPYMEQAISQCEELMNQLESTAVEEGQTRTPSERNQICESLPVRNKLTSDLKGCLLQATLASLPIAFPIASLSTTGLFRKGAQKIFGKTSKLDTPTDTATTSTEIIRKNELPLTGKPEGRNFDQFRSAYNSREISGNDRFVSFYDKELNQRIPAQIIKIEKNGDVVIRELTTDGNFGDTIVINGPELNTIRLSETARELASIRNLSLTGKPDYRHYDQFRNTYNSGEISGDNRFVSVKFEGRRIPVQVVKINNDKSIVVEDSSGNLITITKEGLYDVRVSSTAKQAFTREYSKQRRLATTPFQPQLRRDTYNQNYQVPSNETLNTVEQTFTNTFDNHTTILSSELMKSRRKLTARERQQLYHDQGYWAVHNSAFSDLPLQGWKFHVSATPENMHKIVEKMLPILQRKGIPHKVVSPKHFNKYVQRIGKQSDSQQGKFITVYPKNKKEAKRYAQILRQIMKKHTLTQSDFINIPNEHEIAPGIFARYGRLVDGNLIDRQGREIPGTDDFIINPNNNQIIQDPRGEVLPDFVRSELNELIP